MSEFKYSGPERWAGVPVLEQDRDGLLKIISEMSRHIDFERDMHDRAIAAWKDSIMQRRKYA